jgi:hypothetical protein
MELHQATLWVFYFRAPLMILPWVFGPNWSRRQAQWLTCPLRPVPDVYVISLSMVGMILLAPVNNMSAMDSFFMAVSAGTVTGLNTYVVQFYISKVIPHRLTDKFWH